MLIVVLAHAGLDRFVPGGFGVTIFFFLSGYLITSLLRSEASETGTISIRNFYIRRVCRINPPLWVTLGVAGLLAATGAIKCTIYAPDVVAQTLFYINYVVPADGGNGVPVTSLWSLAVEEHFYLVFPLVFMLVLSRMEGRRAAMWLLGACAVVLGIRIANVLLLTDYSANYYWSHTRIDSILFGCILAVWNNPVLDREKCYRPAATHVALALLVLALCLVIRNDVFRQTIRYTLQGAALFVVFSAALNQGSNGIVNSVLCSRPLWAIGLLSYTIYLSHETVFTLVEQHLGNLSMLSQDVIVVLIVVAYATLMFWLVEKPLATVRRRFGRSRRAVPAGATSASGETGAMRDDPFLVSAPAVEGPT